MVRYSMQDVMIWNYIDSNGYSYEIRFVNVNGAWYAVLMDICAALGIKNSRDISYRVPAYLQSQVLLEMPRHRQKNGVTSRKGINQNNNVDSIDVINYNDTTFFKATTVISEQGIYIAIGNSRKLEARKFMEWISMGLVQFRQAAGLQGYEAMRLMEPQIQQRIQEPEVQKHFVQSMDDIQYDEERDCWVYVGTAPGGDVAIYDIDQNTGEILE